MVESWVDRTSGDGAFAFGVAGVALGFQVISFAGRETLSGLYSYEVLLAYPHDDMALLALEATMLRRSAYLRIGASDGGHRCVYGIVACFAIEGRVIQRECVKLRVTLVPRLQLLTMRKQSRIFQDLSVKQAVESVLAQWGVRRSWRVTQPLERRPYITQYQESDYDFVTRLLADEGIFHFFSHPGGDPPIAMAETAQVCSTELLVLGDNSAAYEPIPNDDSIVLDATANIMGVDLGSHLQLVHRGEGGRLSQENEIDSFVLTRRVRPSSTLLTDFDFRHPTLRLRPTASSLGPTDLLRVHHHHDRGEHESARRGVTEIDDMRAKRLLEQLRADALVAAATSRCRRLVPGHTFELSEHPIGRLCGPYVITSVRYDGRSAEWFAEEEGDMLVNRFECSPSHIPIRPATVERARQVTETAIVTGPAEEEIYCDELGRIKVRFHWDIDGADDAKSSCWLRVMQQWAGAGWGYQFIPRVGMEVVVTFLGGDPDRPLVTGCVYNQHNPPAFSLPESKSRGGIRSYTTPSGNGGYNELSFEDAAGREQVYLRAERDLVELVQQRHETHVEGRRKLRIDGDHLTEVGGDQSVVVESARHFRVEGREERVNQTDRSDVVLGHRIDTVHGHWESVANGPRSTLVEGEERYLARAGMRANFEADATVRVEGSLTTVVGLAEAPRALTQHVQGRASSYSSGETEIVSDTALVLRCGESLLRLSPKSIELIAPRFMLLGNSGEVFGEELQFVAKNDLLVAGEKVTIKSPSAVLGLADEAELLASKISFKNDSADANPELPGTEPVEPTDIELVDEQEEPIGNAHYLLRFEDGSQKGGVLDEDGKASITLTEPATIHFPDFGPEPDGEPGELMPHVVRQGDYLQRIAHRFGFDPESIWTHAKNAALKEAREHGDQLLPGDMLWVPRAAPEPQPVHPCRSNRFEVMVPTVHLRQTFIVDGEPLAEKACHISGAGPAYDDVSDGEGGIDIAVPVYAESVTIVFENGCHFLVNIGHLDPVDTRTGVEQRLRHLAFLSDPEAACVDDEEYAAALTAFQAMHELETTGVLDEATIKTLKEIHGS